MKQLDKFLGRNASSKISLISIKEIKPNRYQPRREFNELELNELAKSIKSYGVIQPIIVRKDREGYELIAGERRYRACMLIGWDNIPAIIQDMDDEKAAAVSLIENLQRKELNYFEEASAYMVLINDFGITQDELAQKIGKSQSAIANKIRLLKLPEVVRSSISTSVITERHARALLKVVEEDKQLMVLRQIYEEELNVRETENFIESLATQKTNEKLKQKENGQQVSMIIRDARIFLNTIKETVNRARKTGIDMLMTENDRDDIYEIVIKIPKLKKGEGIQYKDKKMG